MADEEPTSPLLTTISVQDRVSSSRRDLLVNYAPMATRDRAMGEGPGYETAAFV